MPTGTTSYSRGGSTTSYDGGGGYGDGGDDNADLIRDLLSRRRTFRGAKPRPNPHDRWAAARAAGGGGVSGGISGPSDPNKRLRAAAEDEDLRARIHASQVARRPPPTRMVHGAGIVPGRTMDTLKMSATGRQAYLPQKSRAELSAAEHERIAATESGRPTQRQRKSEDFRRDAMRYRIGGGSLG